MFPVPVNIFPEFLTLTGRYPEYTRGGHVGTGPKRTNRTPKGASHSYKHSWEITELVDPRWPPETGSRCCPGLERPQRWGSEASPASPAGPYFQSGISAVAYVPFPASGPPTLLRLPGWRPAPAVPLAGGGRWAGPGAWRTSKLACGEGWPCSAGRRLVLPDGGLQLLPGEGSRRTGSGKPAARAAPPSLAGAWAGSGWGINVLARSHPCGCSAG